MLQRKRIHNSRGKPVKGFAADGYAEMLRKNLGDFMYNVVDGEFTEVSKQFAEAVEMTPRPLTGARAEHYGNDSRILGEIFLPFGFARKCPNFPVKAVVQQRGVYPWHVAFSRKDFELLNEEDRSEYDFEI